MMLEPIAFSHEQCLDEAREFQSFLGGRTSLKERDEILPFFKARKHLSAFLSVYSSQVDEFNRVAHEYPFSATSPATWWPEIGTGKLTSSSNSRMPPRTVSSSRRLATRPNGQRASSMGSAKSWIGSTNSARSDTPPISKKDSKIGPLTSVACSSWGGNRTSGLGRKTDSTGENGALQSMATRSIA